jgi:hypothetical protein
MAATAGCRSLCLGLALNSLQSRNIDQRRNAQERVVTAHRSAGCPLSSPKFGRLHKERWGVNGRESKRAPMQMSATVAPAESEEPKVEAAVPIEKQGNRYFAGPYSDSQIGF